MKRALNPSTVPVAPTHTQGVEITARRLVFVSGQVGVRADGSLADGLAAQTAQAIANLNAVLTEADMTAEDVVKFTIYLTDADDVDPFIQAAGGTIPDSPVTATLLVVDQLAAPGLLVEIEAIAAR